MNALIIIYPFLSLIIAAALSLLFWNNVKVQKIIGAAGTITFFISTCYLFYVVFQTGIQSVQIGDWSAPFGITFVADMLSCLMLMITAIIALATFFYSLEDISPRRKSKGFYPAYFFMLFGICGAFLTGDIFNLYVWFEVLLVASFVLMVLGNSKAQLEGAVKYVVLSLLASGFMLAGVGILYRLAGSLNMADLALILKDHPEPEMITLAAVFFFIIFGLKAAVFPLFFWLPASYHTPPVAVTALMAGLLTKVGVYALIRFFTLLFVHDVQLTHTFLLMVAGFTMVTGVLGAISRNELRQILSFHIVSQIGYMVMGLALFTPLAVAGSVFYVIHHILVKTNLFLISGIIKITSGSFILSKSGGVYDKFPFIALLFAISAFSLAGVPPLSGFWAKFMLVKAGLQIQENLIVVVALLVGLLTLFSMSKIWVKAFWHKQKNENYKPDYAKSSGDNTFTNLFKEKYLLILPAIFLAVLTLFLSFYPQFLIDLSNRVAGELLNPEQYINAVLNHE